MLNKLNLFTSNNEFYVNKLPIWTAYCIFGLAWFFSEMLAVPLELIYADTIWRGCIIDGL